MALVRQLRVRDRAGVHAREAGRRVALGRTQGAPVWSGLEVRRPRRATLPAQPADPAGPRPAGRSARRRPRSAGTLRRPEDPLLVSPGRQPPVPPVRDRRGRPGTAAADRRAVRRHRADVSAGRRDPVRLFPLPTVRPLLADPRGHALSLRRQRRGTSARCRATSSTTTRPC